MPHLPSLGLHRSSKVVTALTAAMMTVIVVPGMVGDDTPRATEPCRMSLMWCTSIIPVERQRHGWPWTYCTRTVVLPQQAPSGVLPFFASEKVRDHTTPSWTANYPSRPWAQVPWLSWNAWKPWQSSDEDIQFSVALLILDALVAGGVVLVATAAWEARRRRRRSLWQFTLAECLGLLTAAGLAAGWLRHHQAAAEAERRILSQLTAERYREANVRVFWSHQDLAPEFLQRLTGPRTIPEFLQGITAGSIDFDGLSRVNRVSKDESSEEVFDLISRLPRLTTLQVMRQFGNADLTPTDARRIGQLKQIRVLIFNSRQELPAKARTIIWQQLPDCELRCYPDGAPRSPVI